MRRDFPGNFMVEIKDKCNNKEEDGEVGILVAFWCCLAWLCHLRCGKANSHERRAMREGERPGSEELNG